MLAGVRIGALSKMWNGHPARSLVWAPLGGAIHRGFYISDFYISDFELREGAFL